jgi:aldehyde dehydrogenase (NAD+)
MHQSLNFYIDGQWVKPVSPQIHNVINPATEAPMGQINLGKAQDVDIAVKAAKRAFGSFSQTSREERIDLMERMIEAYKVRRNDLAKVITEEMGAPSSLAANLHAMIGQLHIKTALQVLKNYHFNHERGGHRVELEPIGVCALITPWNWPINQIAAKVSPAIACGCTMVLKPSEVSPFSALIWAEIMERAGVPAGVFNMVQGLGPVVGAALSSHPDVDMVSFTGSTGAGIEVARNAAPTIKRVHTELGGKSANILLPDADIKKAVGEGLRAVMSNSGQSCNAPTRMLVPADKMDEAIVAARATLEGITIGDPTQNPDVGPVASKAQYDKIQILIEKGIAEGATLVAGGAGRPEGIEKGYFVQPTVFANVKNDMAIAQEEIFGPVVSIIPYHSVDEAVAIANDSPFGLAGYIQGMDDDMIASVARRLRVGQVLINQPRPDPMAPFGGYKQSGNGREWGDHGFEAFLEVKAILRGQAPAAVSESIATRQAVPV